MSIAAPQMVTVNCPSCGRQYSAPVQSVIDVGRVPRLKTMLLQGQLNVGVCPQCGTGGMLGIPLVYHDPDKELLLCLMPQELPMSEAERQRTIGEMSNAIINGLPSEQRKGYLLQPRVFLSLQTMMEAVLEADGITKEMLQSQEEKARILRELLDTADDSLRLAALIGNYEEQLDYEFFTILTANLQIAEQAGHQEALERLTRLRSLLLERTGTGKRVAQQEKALEEAIGGIDESLTREDLLSRIVGIESENKEQILSVLLALARPLVDYQFFQLLTKQIDQAGKDGDQERVSDLKATRERILELTQRLDAEVREHMQHKAQLLTEIVQSPDREAAVRANLDEIDSAFMSVLETNIAQNEQLGRTEVVELLRSIQSAVVEALTQAAPPEIALIEQLLQADSSDETRSILSENKGMLSEELIRVMDLLARDFAERGDEQTSQQLRGIQAQAKLMLA